MALGNTDRPKVCTRLMQCVIAAFMNDELEVPYTVQWQKVSYIALAVPRQGVHRDCHVCLPPNRSPDRHIVWIGNVGYIMNTPNTLCSTFVFAGSNCGAIGRPVEHLPKKRNVMYQWYTCDEQRVITWVLLSELEACGILGSGVAIVEEPRSKHERELNMGHYYVLRAGSEVNSNVCRP